VGEVPAMRRPGFIPNPCARGFDSRFGVAISGDVMAAS